MLAEAPAADSWAVDSRRPTVTVHEEAGLDERWDAFLRRTAGSYSQSSCWAQVKAVSGLQAARVVVEEDGEIVAGCQLLMRHVPAVGPVAYASRAPVVSRPDDDSLVDQVIDGLDALGSARRIAYVKVQGPLGNSGLPELLKRRGWVGSGLEAGPTATVRVDLDAPADRILARMRPSMRRHISKARRGELLVRPAGYDEIERFWTLVERTSQRKGFSPFPVEYYKEIWRSFAAHDHVTLVLVEHDGRLLAGLFILGFGDAAYYKMGGWSGERSDLHPNELGHWAAMTWAREHGYRYYDLDGIDPAVARAALAGTLPKEARRGTAHFKLGFGGEAMFAPEACDRTYRRLLALPLRIVAPRLREGRVSSRMVGRAT
jgi:lipid II:glycine glycyltransferase (peptidoglycan interpeptide bridge formation enzyme)